MCMWAALLLVVCAGAQTEDQWRFVQTAQGPVRGGIHPDGGLYTFYNIPYASVPTGSSRFQGPRPAPVWMHMFDAIDRGIICQQTEEFVELMPIPLNMQEDCLVANIFVPDTAATNLPVLVNIHGGAYQIGFGNGDQFFSLVRTKKIIVVSFNYRLGLHGFLCLGTEDVPGNAGLKDQIALLRWVNQNIANFGGNPDDVTLQGCSAGGGSVDILTISGLTNGLFKKAIIESGVSFGSVGVVPDPIENAQKYANLLNFDGDVDDIAALEHFYKTASYELLNSGIMVIISNQNSNYIFGPCVEKDVGQERVIHDAPINILKQGNYTKVPLLYGFAEMEGLMNLHQFDIWKDLMNEKFSDFLPAELEFENEEEKEEVAGTIKEFYFGNQPISEINIMSYIDYFTDILFGYSMLKALTHRIESMNDTIFLYKYTFTDDETPFVPHTEVRQVNHCNQYIAVVDEDKSNTTEEYRQMKTIMRELWMNFILTGSPVVEGSQFPSWPPATAFRSPYMLLGRDLQLQEVLLQQRAAFWDSIYEQYYRIPVPPQTEESSDSNHTNVLSYVFMYFILLVILLLVVAMIFF